MPTAVNIGRNLFERAKRLRDYGWDAEEGNGRQDWRFRIISPDGTYVQLHSTPSDVNWLKTVMRKLDKLGFSRDEEKYEAERKMRIAEEDEKRRVANEKALAEAQKRALAVARAAGPFGPQVARLDWIFSEHPLPETKRVLIVPELAAKILAELNTANRPLRNSRVQYWAKLMRQNRWHYTHQGVAFDTVGRLQDGQHRLAAAVQEGFTLDVNVSVGMPVENFGVVDVGGTRTGADTMAIKGTPYTTTTAGAVRHIAVFELYGAEMRVGLKNRMPNDLISEKQEEYGEFLNYAVAKANEIYHGKGSPKMATVALATGIYLIGSRLPKDDPRLAEFLRGYAEGTNLPAGDIRIVLRDFMFGLKHDYRKRGLPTVDQLAIFVKAWNLWIQGKSLTVLGWRKDELFPRPFLPPRDED